MKASSSLERVQVQPITSNFIARRLSALGIHPYGYEGVAYSPSNVRRWLADDVWPSPRVRNAVRRVIRTELRRRLGALRGRVPA